MKNPGSSKLPGFFYFSLLAEPDADFALCGLNRVRAVDQVLLDLQAPVAAEVATDGARSSSGRIGGACQRAEARDNALAFSYDRYHWAGEHELNQRLVERLAFVLCVVLGEQFASRFQLLQLGDGVAFGFNAGKDLSGQTALDAVWLD